MIKQSDWCNNNLNVTNYIFLQIFIYLLLHQSTEKNEKLFKIKLSLTLNMNKIKVRSRGDGACQGDASRRNGKFGKMGENNYRGNGDR